MGMRTVTDPRGTDAVLVDKLLGNSYEVVRKVAFDLEYIRHLSANMKSIYRVDQNLDAIKALNDALEDIGKITEHMASILLVAENLPTIKAVGDNIGAIRNINEYLPVIIEVETNLPVINTVGTNIIAVDTVALNIAAIQAVNTNMLALLDIHANMADIVLDRAKLDALPTNDQLEDMLNARPVLGEENTFTEPNIFIETVQLGEHDIPSRQSYVSMLVQSDTEPAIALEDVPSPSSFIGSRISFSRPDGSVVPWADSLGTLSVVTVDEDTVLYVGLTPAALVDLEGTTMRVVYAFAPSLTTE